MEMLCTEEIWREFARHGDGIDLERKAWDLTTLYKWRNDDTIQNGT